MNAETPHDRLIDPTRLATLLTSEVDRFTASHPRSRELHDRASRNLPFGVPMNWMVRWPGPFPIYITEAQGAQCRDVDGVDYVDFCLGDTGAMAGHSPPATVAAIAAQAGRGITHMLPIEAAVDAAAALEARFGLPYWQFTLSATDANRFAIRLARQITGRPRILIFNHCYHGSVDETVATLGADGVVRPRRGNVGPAIDPSITTRIVEFNDIQALDIALGHADVACVLAEPALTNMGIVLPDPGFHRALRDATRRHGVLLIIDETHTLCAGPRGGTGAFSLEPDIVTLGKAIGGGLPVGAYGMTTEVAQRTADALSPDDADVGGIGGTLAGYALSLVAVSATLGSVLTDEAYRQMEALALQWETGVTGVLRDTRTPWHVTRLGTRAEYHFRLGPARNGSEQWASVNPMLERYLHLFALNRGVLMTPFHNMALMSPATTMADVSRHTAVFREAVTSLNP